MAPDLQDREISSEPIRIAASMCKTDPPDATFVLRFSVTYTVSDYR